MGSGGRRTLEFKQEAAQLVKSNQSIAGGKEFQMRLPWRLCIRLTDQNRAPWALVSQADTQWIGFLAQFLPPSRSSLGIREVDLANNALFTPFPQLILLKNPRVGLFQPIP